MGQPVVHWEIAAKDAAKLQAFYGELFGWTIDRNNPMNYGMVRTGGTGGIDGGIFTAEGNIPRYVTIYVQVPDLQATLDRAATLGGKAVIPPTPIPGVGAFAMFQDPESNLIGLFRE